jgi:ElaB/YqjD/DUF883 family membrane-anchored ribosome-binding protein
MTETLNSREDTRKDVNTLEQEIKETRAEMNETLDALEEKLTAGQLLDQCLRFFGRSGSEIGSSLGRAVKENPVPVLLTATGIAWMMFSPGRRTSGRSYDYRYGDELYPDVDSSVADTSPTLRDRVNYSAEAARDQLGRSTEAMREAASRTSETMRDTVNRTSETVRDTVSRTSENVKDTVNRTAYGVRDSMARTRNIAQEQAQWARDRFNMAVEEQPLVLGAIGLAVGAAIGALLQPTEYEDRLMGETRDKALAKGKEVAAQTYNQGLETATQAVNRLKEDPETSAADPHSGARISS